MCITSSGPAVDAIRRSIRKCNGYSMPPTILVCAKNCGQRVAFQFDDHWPECHGMPMVRETDAPKPEPKK